MQAHFCHYDTHSQSCLPCTHSHLACRKLQELMQRLYGDDGIPVSKNSCDCLSYAVSTSSSKPSASTRHSLHRMGLLGNTAGTCMMQPCCRAHGNNREES